MFVFFLFTMGVTLVIMPHCSSLTQLFILAGINGFSIGSFDTAINVWILEIWAEDSGPFMQALHFTYGIGSFVAPLICEPFLSTESIHTGSHGAPMASSAGGGVESTTLSSSALLANASQVGLVGLATNVIADVDEFVIYIPYAIAGGLTVLGSILVFVLYLHKPYIAPTKPKVEYDVKPGQESCQGRLIGRGFGRELLLKSFFFFPIL